MATIAALSKRNSHTQEDRHDPFDTPFDNIEDGGDGENGEDDDDEWWNEEDTVTPTPPKPASAARITQWPRLPEGSGHGVTMAPESRITTRKVIKRYSVQKPTRDKSKGRQRKQNAKAGIKLVTNFSRHQATAPPQQLQPARGAPHMGRFLDLAALQALDSGMPQTSTAFWKTKKSKDPAKNPIPGPFQATAQPQTTVSSNELANPAGDKRSLAPSPLKLSDDLSPNDRPIFIGISIPSGQVEDHVISPQTASSDTTKIVRSYENRTPINQTPDTPTIIITPAQESSAWSPLDDLNMSPARPASSIYSQYDHSMDRIYTHRDAPPVPAMPASILEEERQRIAAQKSYFSPDSDDVTTWGDDDDLDRSATRSRAMSAYTVFEEDESPIIARAGRAVPVTADRNRARGGSVSTVGTRPRSMGWWNYITTPFLTRSNTTAAPEFETEEPPALPSLAIAAAKVQEAEREGKSWEKAFSPLTPETSVTVDSDQWWNLDSKQARSTDYSPVLRETRHKVQPSTESIPIVRPETVDFSVATPPTLAPDVGSQLRRDNTSATQISTSGFSTSDREVPMLLDTPSVRRNKRNCSHDQSRSADGESSPVQQVSRGVAQPFKPSIPAVATPPPPYSPAPSRVKYRAFYPPGHALGITYPGSPAPASPGLSATMTSQGAIPMSDVPLTPASNRRPINLNSGYPGLPAQQSTSFFTPENLYPPSKKAKKAEAKRRRHEKEDALAHRAGGFWRGRGCIPDRGCYGRTGAEGRKRRRCYLGLILVFLSIIILAVVLATTLHRKSNTLVEPSQWLNLTGFPPVFLGISTVIAPDNLVSNTGCVFPATQWSCDLPKELQGSIAPNPPNQPNFLLQIQWDNSSSANATFSNVTGNPDIVTRAVGNPVSAGQFIRNILLKARQIVTFIPSPAPPSFAEEFFLGNTTDDIVSNNKAGEPTPFYISFLSNTFAVGKRDFMIRQSSTTPFPNVTSAIPGPSSSSDGTAAPANLLPFPSQQPIRLYDRGLPTEHYGFYTYFDRSIFLKSLALLNDSNSANEEVPDDENGGATKSEAAFRCTWAQTRFLVQMWTRMNTTSQLLNSTQPSSSSNPATDTQQPGSFPYPITITIDRHGGDPDLKMLYCYSMDDRERLVAGSGKLGEENRGFGGTLINPAPGLFDDSSDPSLGGFDGGNGGCSCQWSNFQPITK